ncbi:MAG: regulatory protein MerR, partial [Frankiales bacterium]|nr:regulatory protein MerR [Frankiales bacterium]
RGHGGSVLRLPGADAAGRGLGRAALALDSEAVTLAVQAEVERRGVVRAWDDVLRPVLAAVGSRWAATGQGVEVEHLLSDCISSVLHRVVAARRLTPPPRPVLLASAPDEQHCLPLYALAAALAEQDLPTRILGPATPLTALVAAVRRTGPCAVFLWSQLAPTGDSRTLHALPVTRPAVVIVAGGPGWAEDALPPGASFAPDLASARDLVLQAGAV